MNKFNLELLGVQEMATDELINVEGGGFFGAIWGGIKAAGNWLVQSFLNALR